MDQHRQIVCPNNQNSQSFKSRYLNQFVLLSLLFTLVLFLFGCASSGVQREAAESVDLGVRNAKRLVSGDGDIADTYQNATQATKGAIIGGAAGALTGGMSGIGVLPGTIVGGILGASYGSYIDSTTNKRDRLENRGVQLVVIGDQILIWVPSERIFEEMTAIIKPQAFSTLDMMKTYINRYVKMMVKVTAYTDDSGNPIVDQALAKQQAEAVAKFLVASGVDARLLYAVGAGSSNLVLPSSGEWDTDNYRIEITLEKLYV